MDLVCLEEHLWAATAGVVATPPTTQLVAAIRDQTLRYTSERQRLAEPDADAAGLAARALFFTLADAPKVGVPLGELAAHGALPGRSPLRVLDVGAGCGAILGGLRLALPERAIELVAVDRDRAALAVLAALARRLDVPARTIAADAAAAELPAGPFELVTAAGLVNELPAAARAPLLRALLARLAPDGALVVIEPALRETARALHRLRDELGAEAVVFAPCTRRGPCPALLDEESWCHEDRPALHPPRLRELVRLTGLRREGYKFAYLTLRRGGAPLGGGAGRVVRVVSGPLDSKGVVERLVCGEAGRWRLRVLKRAGREACAALAAARRGDLLVVREGTGGEEVSAYLPIS